MDQVMKINFLVRLEWKESGGKQTKTDKEYETGKQDGHFRCGAQYVLQACRLALKTDYCMRNNKNELINCAFKGDISVNLHQYY